MFVKYSCGCVGFLAAGKTWVITACDHSYDDNLHSIFERDGMEDKTTTPLPEEELIPLLRELSALIRDGYALRDIRWRLGVKSS